MIAPVVHLNGTSREELEKQLRGAVEGLQRAREEMEDASPNQRDYYLLGQAAWVQAHREHQLRVAKVREVEVELTQILEVVLDS